MSDSTKPSSLWKAGKLASAVVAAGAAIAFCAASISGYDSTTASHDPYAKIAACAAAAIGAAHDAMRPSGAPTRLEQARSDVEAISRDFYVRAAPADLVPDKVDYSATYSASYFLNGSMTSSFGNGPEVSSKLNAEIDSSGEVAMQSAFSSESPRTASQWARMHLAAHESAHGAFAKILAARPSSYFHAAASRAYSAAGLDEADAKKLSDRIYDNPWAQTSLNESYADAMALGYAAHKLERADFERYSSQIIAQRRQDEQPGIDTIHAEAKGSILATFTYSKLSDHMTSSALLAMASRGYDALHSMAPEKLSESALDSAFSGLARTAAQFAASVNDLAARGKYNGKFAVLASDLSNAVPNEQAAQQAALPIPSIRDKLASRRPAHESDRAPTASSAKPPSAR